MLKTSAQNYGINMGNLINDIQYTNRTYIQSNKHVQATFFTQSLRLKQVAHCYRDGSHAPRHNRSLCNPVFLTVSLSNLSFVIFYTCFLSFVLFFVLQITFQVSKTVVLHCQLYLHSPLENSLATPQMHFGKG